MRWWLVYRGTRCALVRARLATEARAEGTHLLGRYGATQLLPGTKLTVRRAKAADVARFRAAQAQARAGAGACRLVA